MVVCGFGLGSSMILRMTLDGVLSDEGIKAETFCSDETTAKGESCHLILTSASLAKLFANNPQPVVIINNFLNKDEVRQKAVPIIQKLMAG